MQKDTFINLSQVFGVPKMANTPSSPGLFLIFYGREDYPICRAIDNILTRQGKRPIQLKTKPSTLSYLLESRDPEENAITYFNPVFKETDEGGITLHYQVLSSSQGKKGWRKQTTASINLAPLNPRVPASEELLLPLAQQLLKLLETTAA